MTDLMDAARHAALAAYAPYSRFRVGAAVRVDGVIHVGGNIENASYGLSLCAERVAIFRAIMAGGRRLDALAVACIDAAADGPPGSLMPCGACRQVISEFADPDLPIEVDRVGIFRLADLLPSPFRL
jgi:cytidine deaminase